MPDTIRTFIGVPVTVPSRLATVWQELATLGRGVKPVDSDSTHITLKFLGDTSPPQVDRIAAIIAEHANTVTARDTVVRGLNAFPNRQRPAIMWAALEGTADLVTLAGSLETALESEGFAREGRAYTPHLTLARVRAIKAGSRSQIPDGVMELMAQHADTDFGTVRIDKVVLYQSVLSDAGPEYSRLATVKLA
jgi:2'-5' RNA ligase